MYNKKCYICGTQYDLDANDDSCPVCNWMFVGWEDEMDENEKTSVNPITIREAKQNFAKGLNIWGKPLSQSK